MQTLDLNKANWHDGNDGISIRTLKISELFTFRLFPR